MTVLRDTRSCRASVRVEGRREPGTSRPLATATRSPTDTWHHTYSRDEAAFPLASLRGAKYWPPVSRIDGVYGDRNVVCSCAPISAYEES